jgi:hypothetical protein
VLGYSNRMRCVQKGNERIKTLILGEVKKTTDSSSDDDDGYSLKLCCFKNSVRESC